MIEVMRESGEGCISVGNPKTRGVRWLFIEREWEGNGFKFQNGFGVKLRDCSRV